MTTFQIILLLCILVATVGLVIYFEKKAAKDCDGTVRLVDEKPLTKEGVVKVLTRFEATDIHEESSRN